MDDAHFDREAKYALDRLELERAQGLTALAYYTHLANKRWWHDVDGNPVDRNVGEMIALCHSELSEALEGHRKNLKDDHLSQYDSYDVELVDCLIRILDMLGKRDVPVHQIYIDKMTYNANRRDHKLTARAEDNGKKY